MLWETLGECTLRKARRSAGGLYYPTITVPNGPWLRQVLLHWDQMGSITPDVHDDRIPDHPRYTDEIRELYEMGQFRPFNLLFWYEGNDERVQEFCSEFKLVLNGQDFRFNVLGQRGLAAELPRKEQWYAFEEQTALLTIPKTDVSLVAIARFKAARRDHLLRFRAALDDLQSALNICPEKAAV